MEAYARQIVLRESQWVNLSDEEIALVAQGGNIDAEEYLLQKYEKMVYAWTRSFFLQGGEIDDVIQEGMIGLYKAIRDFTEGTSSFWAFAKLCITRNVISAIKGTTRQKHIPLNSYTSLHKPINDYEGERTLLETLTNSKVSDPETVAITRDQLKETEKTIRKFLSDFEFQVFQLYLAGYTYREIAEHLDVHTKSIDNALCRVKIKIERIQLLQADYI